FRVVVTGATRRPTACLAKMERGRAAALDRVSVGEGGTGAADRECRASGNQKMPQKGNVQLPQQPPHDRHSKETPHHATKASATQRPAERTCSRLQSKGTTFPFAR